MLKIFKSADQIILRLYHKYQSDMVNKLFRTYLRFYLYSCNRKYNTWIKILKESEKKSISSLVAIATERKNLRKYLDIVSSKPTDQIAMKLY